MIAEMEKPTTTPNTVILDPDQKSPRAQEFEENRDLVRGIIAEGCEKARDVARQTLEEVHQAMGMKYR